MIIIRNKDGSIKYAESNEYINQLSHNVNYIDYAVEDMTADNYTSDCLFTLADDTSTALVGTYQVFTYRNVEYSGYRVYLPQGITKYAGEVKVVSRHYDKDGNILYAYPFTLTINETVATLSEDITITTEQYQNLLTLISSYQHAYDSHNIRKYATLEEAKEEISKLTIGMVEAILIGDTLYFYYKDTATSFKLVRLDVSNFNGFEELKALIPTKTSDLENDSGFITLNAVGLENYYTKVEIDTLHDETIADIDNGLTSLEKSLKEYSDNNKSDLQTQITNNKGNITTNKNNLDSEIARAKEKETALETAINTNKANIESNTKAIETLNASASTTGSVDYKVKKAIDDIIDNAPETYDTFKEIADYIANDKTSTASMLSSIQKNTQAIEDTKSDITSKDTALKTLISEEEVRAKASESDLQTQITANKGTFASYYTKSESDALLDKKASLTDLNSYVNLSGTQTITGIKTFNGANNFIGETKFTNSSVPTWSDIATGIAKSSCSTRGAFDQAIIGQVIAANATYSNASYSYDILKDTIKFQYVVKASGAAPTLGDLAILDTSGLKVSGSSLTLNGNEVALSSEIPTKLSQLVNDKGFITSDGVDVDLTDYYKKTAVDSLISGVNTSIANETSARKESDTTLQTNIDSEVTRAKEKESELESAIATNTSAIANLNASASTDGSIDYKIKVAIDSIVDNAPTTYDTFKEIADYIASDTTATASMLASIQTNTQNIEDNHTLANNAYAVATSVSENLSNNYYTKTQVDTKLEDISAIPTLETWLESEENVAKALSPTKSMPNYVKWKDSSGNEFGRMIMLIEENE